MDKKNGLKETPSNIKEALSKYAGRMIGDEIGSKIKMYVKQAVSEALKEANVGGEVAMDPRETVVDQHSAAHNPAINKRAEELKSEDKLAQAGYVDEKAAARKEFYKKKHGG